MNKIIILCVIILLSESVHSLHAQSPTDKFKRSAILEMSEGRYGEAIDLLNKYITANPQVYEGHYLRGLCYEARAQYELAVYDLRSALKLNPNEQKVINSLSKVTKTWYTQLYNKIEGHKREIAINPQKAINYLEIGKCYKNLGNWSEAEEWYDKYIALEEPSADEVIRYTEILAKNNHIQKGEVILKKYVQKYSKDHRLWSRYGYFTLWLGKNKIASEAFEEALKFRPFFKEAIDGYHLAQGKSAIYTVNDTSSRYNKKTGTFQSKRIHVYAIDRYFRILQKERSNDSIRLILIKELIKVNRLEEAKQQLNIVNKNYLTEKMIKSLENEIEAKKDSLSVVKINRLLQLIRSNPNNREVVKELANFYSTNLNIDSASIIYERYLAANPYDDEIRFEYAKKLSWFKLFDKAKFHVEFLLNRNPLKLDYQILRGQIAVWTNSDLEIANSLLTNVLSKEPNNLQALLGLAYLNYNKLNFASAENYISQIEKLEPLNNDLAELKYNLFITQKQKEEERFLILLEQARNNLSENKCDLAISNYKDYLKYYPDNKKVKLELANAYVCANDYNNAIKIYDLIIQSDNDYNLIKQRAKWYFWSGDSITALSEFKYLLSINNDDVEAKLFLGDCYFKLKDYSNAKIVYSELLSLAPSSKLFKDRLNWLPEDVISDKSFAGFLKSIPNYTLLSPEYFHFYDNLGFKYNLFGLRSEFGITKILSLGGSFYRGDIFSNILKKKFNLILGTVNLIPTKLIKISLSHGKVDYIRDRKKSITDLSLKSELEGKYSLAFSLKENDATQALFSPFLIDTNLFVTEYSIDGSYISTTNMVISGNYSFRRISDANKAYQFLVALGKKFTEDFTAGYEYYNLNYDFETTLYYSPGNFESHKLWANYNLLKDEFIDLTMGGKIGVIPSNDFLIKEFNSKLTFKVIDSFTIQGQLTFSENARDLLNYRSTSASIIAFWVF